jgi:hypothetical protein
VDCDFTLGKNRHNSSKNSFYDLIDVFLRHGESEQRLLDAIKNAVARTTALI